jgi:hypothetical protein
MWKNEGADIAKGGEKMWLQMGQSEMVYKRMRKRKEVQGGN